LEEAGMLEEHQQGRESMCRLHDSGLLVGGARECEGKEGVQTLIVADLAFLQRKKRESKRKERGRKAHLPPYREEL
jgi:hypothetical protein